VTIGLRAQLLAAIDATFIMDLQHAQFGYARVTSHSFSDGRSCFVHARVFK
jgi:hypothetical protein